MAAPVNETSARSRSHYLLVTVLGVVAGFALASLLNTQLMGMAFLEIVAVAALSIAVVLAGYTLIRRQLTR
jgi:hypothetical protein